MQDQWYGDKRDLVKWGTLLELARIYAVRQVLQVLYYRSNTWGPIEIDGNSVPIPNEVIQHFRDVKSICNFDRSISVKVLDREFSEREQYLEHVIAAINARDTKPGIVFLDPDTGLETLGGNADLRHVRSDELNKVWSNLNVGDVLVFYQHQTNRSGAPWIPEKKEQFADALQIELDRVKLAFAPGIAKDVAFFFVKKEWGPAEGQT